jgi:hypothetical protein
MRGSLHYATRKNCVASVEMTIRIPVAGKAVVEAEISKPSLAEDTQARCEAELRRKK